WPRARDATRGVVSSPAMDSRALDIAKRTLERPADQRATYLEGACGDDAALRAQTLEVMRIMQPDGGRQNAPSRTAVTAGDKPTADFSARPGPVTPAGFGAGAPASTDSATEGPGS